MGNRSIWQASQIFFEMRMHRNIGKVISRINISVLVMLGLKIQPDRDFLAENGVTHFKSFRILLIFPYDDIQNNYVLAYLSNLAKLEVSFFCVNFCFLFVCISFFFFLLMLFAVLFTTKGWHSILGPKQSKPDQIKHV